ncbi:MAG: tRNA-splicing endonuclease subunit sen54 [Bathelium mastoideum]|nr:MAG: tRNA-splicing endonuclease subunit sen54 [Bathelium mastoideum]
MADVDEDVPHTTGPGAVEIDLADETQDFRFLNSLSVNDPISSKLPKRGEKDFEPHATNLQADMLAASRAAMHAAIAVPRLHNPKTHQIAHYDPASGGSYIDRPTGVFQKTMGVVRGGKQGRQDRLWLLPEETLYLLERGSLDVRWPADRLGPDGDVAEKKQLDDEGEGDYREEGIPMSLQAAYAAFLGIGPSRPTLEQYLVYAGLKRAGYIVFRAGAWARQMAHPSSHAQTNPTTTSGPSWPWSLGIFRELWRRITNSAADSDPARTVFGPLVKPGLYRSYAQIYRLLHLIPFHNPRPLPSTSLAHPSPPGPTADTPFQIHYHVHKPTPTFRKSHPPSPPNFHIAVLSARDTSLPTPAQLDGLLAETPLTPPVPDAGTVGQRLRQGWRSVVLAVVDAGVVSYVRVAEAGFGREAGMWERKGMAGRGKKGGGKRGGKR